MGWTPTFQPKFRNEKQLWEQLLLERQFKRLKITNRTRLEIRDIAYTHGIACRLRNQLLVNVLFGKSKWSVVVYNEPFINLNMVGNGPKSGLNQNWFFAGLNRKFNKHINAEVGYMNNFINNESQSHHANRMNHTIMANIYFDVND